MTNTGPCKRVGFFCLALAAHNWELNFLCAEIQEVIKFCYC